MKHLKTNAEQLRENFNEIYEKLVDNNFFTEEELHLICCINGNTIKTLNDCIYARYGYRDYEQLTEE